MIFHKANAILPFSFLIFYQISRFLLYTCIAKIQIRSKGIFMGLKAAKLNEDIKNGEREKD